MRTRTVGSSFLGLGGCQSTAASSRCSWQAHSDRVTSSAANRAAHCARTKPHRRCGRAAEHADLDALIETIRWIIPDPQAGPFTLRIIPEFFVAAAAATRRGQTLKVGTVEEWNSGSLEGLNIRPILAIFQSSVLPNPPEVTLEGLKRPDWPPSRWPQTGLCSRRSTSRCYPRGRLLPSWCS